MLKIRHLNIDKAIGSFLENVDGLAHLPFITDEEMARLYGEEVAESLAEIARYNNRENICLDCPSRCCLLVDCEFYYPGFSQCPVYPYRPALCRMHFCEKFPAGDISFIREFADIFLNGLIEAKSQGFQPVLLFDCPPLGKQIPQLVAASSSWIDAVKEGKMDAESAMALIQAEVEKFKNKIRKSGVRSLDFAASGEDGDCVII